MEHHTQSPDITRGNWWEVTTVDVHLHRFRRGVLRGVVATALRICRQEEELFNMLETVSEADCICYRLAICSADSDHLSLSIQDKDTLHQILQ